MMFRIIVRSSLFLCCIILLSCSTEPKPIDYNADQCHRCKMIISNEHFGTEVITTKGRVQMFDAIECLIPEVLQNGEDAYSHILVTDYLNPGIFIDARKAQYLISQKLPSPMGAFLSAYSTKEAAIKIEETDFNGQIYSWESILNHFKDLQLQ